MVWFQCEDCGENLKKPKLLNHFRICSATRLSCIDCGEIFGQQSVQGHTQCITEAEKYGPKGQGKAPNGTAAKPKNEAKQKPEIDVNVGLSERPPWFCSLCNTQATSKQTLLLHADGKKHRAKARAFHAANKQPEDAEKSTLNAVASPGSTQKDELPGTMKIEQPKERNPPEDASPGTMKIEQPKERNPPEDASKYNSPEVEKGNLLSSKKRKLEATGNDSTGNMAGGGVSGELGNGEVIQIERAEKPKGKHRDKKAKQVAAEEHKLVEDSSTKEDAKKKIKWKKLIKSALKSDPDKVLKLRKLRKLVLGSLRESGFTEDESKLTEMLEEKINSSSRFTVDGKYVRLAAKS